ncbi:MAG: hypothetical protein ACUVUF_01150 [Candidatus Bathycorpusculaceae bacterium]
MVGVKLDVKARAETVNFDVKAKLEERERRSQMVVVGFSLFLATKPSVVKFEIEGVATLTGKDAEINKMLEVDPETKVPYVFQRIYQHAFMAMYLFSTILDAPPPPYDLLFSKKQGVPREEVSVETGETEAVDVEVVAEEVSVSEK